MPKDFKKHFTKDLGKAITKGRKEVAKTVVRSLTEKGPWWTGTFGENWIVSKSPVQATKKRKPDFPYYLIPDPTARQIKNPRVPNVTLNQDLFVGNRAEYAGFAINAPGQTRPDLKGNPVTYAQHGTQHALTAIGPNWYNIYTKGGLINKDIALAFKKVGFK
tara:strand:+ start:1229 stop:1714 length:486 start_codon:yes stop_codon:yes gene_type:complete